jgi:hypothetical protein
MSSAMLVRHAADLLGSLKRGDLLAVIGTDYRGLEVGPQRRVVH